MFGIFSSILTKHCNVNNVGSSVWATAYGAETGSILRLYPKLGISTAATLLALLCTSLGMDSPDQHHSLARTPWVLVHII